VIGLALMMLIGYAQVQTGLIDTTVERNKEKKLAEIEKNEFNLSLPRYIDSQPPRDLQDIAGHLQGGIPAADIDALER